MRVHSAMTVAIVSAWMGVHAHAAAAQSFEERWSIIPNAHAEQPPDVDNQVKTAPQSQPPREAPPRSMKAPIAASQIPRSKARPAVRSSKGGFTGKASFYSYRTGETASGSSFNRDLPTAAHRTLPFGTKVRVTNLKNNRSVVVTITDRGPHASGRVLDLSLQAARAIGITDRDGIAQIHGEVL